MKILLVVTLAAGLAACANQQEASCVTESSIESRQAGSDSYIGGYSSKNQAGGAWGQGAGAGCQHSALSSPQAPDVDAGAVARGILDVGSKILWVSIL